MFCVGDLDQSRLSSNEMTKSTGDQDLSCRLD